MKIRQKIGKGFKSLVDFPRWMGWKQIKDSAKELPKLAKIVTSVEVPQHKETFEEAVQRLGLSEKDIREQTKQHGWRVVIFMTLAVVLLGYAIYLLFMHRYQGFLLGLAVGLLAGSFVFREHFYYFQMKKRRLGCTFQDWIHFVLGRGKT